MTLQEMTFTFNDYLVKDIETSLLDQLNRSVHYLLILALYRYTLNILQTDLHQCSGYIGPLQKEKIPRVIPLPL